RGGLLRHACLEADVPGEIGGVAGGLQDVAKDHLVDLAGRDLGPLERALRRDHAEVGSGNVSQRAAVGAERGARSIHDHDVPHSYQPPCSTALAIPLAISIVPPLFTSTPLM